MYRWNTTLKSRNFSKCAHVDLASHPCYSGQGTQKQRAHVSSGGNRPTNGDAVLKKKRTNGDAPGSPKSAVEIRMVPVSREFLVEGDTLDVVHGFRVDMCAGVQLDG
jgi:hypothetical protein